MAERNKQNSEMSDFDNSTGTNAAVQTPDIDAAQTPDALITNADAPPVVTAQDSEVPEQSQSAKKLAALSRASHASGTEGIDGGDGTGEPLPIPQSKMTVRQRWDNYWYHHKFATIFGIAAVIFVVICVVQMCGRVEYDLHVIYCGNDSRSKADDATTIAALEKLVDGDYSGDGEIHVDLLDITWLSDYYREWYAMQGLNFSAEANSNAKMQFDQEMQSGQMIICLLDRDLYDTTKENTGVFESWETILGEMPENAYDDCAILLSDLPIGHTSGFSGFSKDTVLCVRKKGELSFSMTDAEREAYYKYHVDVVKKMIAYQPNA